MERVKTMPNQDNKMLPPKQVTMAAQLLIEWFIKRERQKHIKPVCVDSEGNKRNCAFCRARFS